MIDIEIVISKQIKKELLKKKFDNAHGITRDNIQEHLINPTKQIYVLDINNVVKEIELWTVLEERPSKRNGYKIVFNQESNKFGLGFTDKQGILHYLGDYGTFIDALNCM